LLWYIIFFVMKSLTLILTCLLLPYLAYSQEEESKNSVGYFVYGGLQMPQLNEMNTFMEKSGYPKLPENHFSGGFAIYKETGKIFNTVELFGYNSQQTMSGNIVTLNVIGSSISFGYKINFSDNDNFRLIPSLALNFYRTTLKTLVAPKTTMAYSSYIGNGTMEEINNDGIGGAFNLMLLTSPFTKWQSFTAGVRTGLNLTIESSWNTLNNQNVTDVPEVEPLGFNASLVLGLRF